MRFEREGSLAIVKKQQEQDDEISEVKEAVSSLESKISEISGELKKKFEEELVYEINKEEIKGEDGKDGIDGKDGKDGVDGKDGKDGINGIDGKDGRDGVDGKDGIDGKDGKDGAIGPRGEDGKDGSPDTPDQVADKLNTLTEKVDWKVLKNVPYDVKNGKPFMRGGGATKFTELQDAFNSYTGLAGKGLRVNGTETGIDTYTPTDTDEKVKLSASDPTAGYLDDKVGGLSNSVGVGGLNVGGYSGKGFTAKGSNPSFLELIRTITSGNSLIGIFRAGSTSNSTVAGMAFKTGSTGSKGKTIIQTHNGSTMQDSVTVDESQNMIVNGSIASKVAPTLTYTGGVLTSIAYSNGNSKTLSYNGDGTLNQVVFTAPDSTTITKSFTYSSGILQSITVS